VTVVVGKKTPGGAGGGTHTTVKESRYNPAKSSSVVGREL
jgi:hypothetical protein